VKGRVFKYTKRH